MGHQRRDGRVTQRYLFTRIDGFDTAFAVGVGMGAWLVEAGLTHSFLAGDTVHFCPHLVGVVLAIVRLSWVMEF